MAAQHLRAVTKHPVEGASPGRWLQCLQRELSTTISSLLDQFVGDQRAAMGSAFEVARAHASVASTANTDSATCMAGIATAMTQRLQVRSSCLQPDCKTRLHLALHRTVQAMVDWATTTWTLVSILQTSRQEVEAEKAQAAESRSCHQQKLLDNVSACQSHGVQPI